METQQSTERWIKALHLNPAYYGEEYTAACRELDEASADLEQIDEEEPEYVKDFDLAWKRYIAAYRAWEELDARLGQS